MLKVISGLEELKFSPEGLMPAIIQSSRDGQVLMLAYMNEESLQKTLDSGETWFWSRSRRRLWHKGETSGNVQRVKEIRYDCDADTLLLKVEQSGPACHTGNTSCFYSRMAAEEGVSSGPAEIIPFLSELIDGRKREMPRDSYTTYLFEKGLDKVLKKVGEEAAEVIIAAKNPRREELIYETADLIYHLLVLLREQEVDYREVLAELSRRHGGTENEI